jgi:tRNA(Ile)-lysidine synthase
MLRPGERLGVACSGGADSVALVQLLKEISPSLKVKLRILHFDHRLRRGSSRDFHFVETLAKRLKIPFAGGRRKTGQKRELGLSPEEKARELRYRFFETVLRKGGIRKLALAHHADDQAETVLMRLLQGTGLRGLQGMRPVSRRKGITLVRPLIEAGRGEIRKFLRDEGIPFREDSTNRSRRFLRNRIRLELLPFLEKRFSPKIRDLLCRLAQTSASELGDLDDWTRSRWKDYVRSRRNGTLRLDRERFLSLPGLLQFRLLDQALHAIDGGSGLDFDSWKKVEQGLEKGRFRMTLPKRLDLRLTPTELLIHKEG